MKKLRKKELNGISAAFHMMAPATVQIGNKTEFILKKFL